LKKEFVKLVGQTSTQEIFVGDMAILTKKRMGMLQGGAIVIGTVVIITIVLAGMFS